MTHDLVPSWISRTQLMTGDAPILKLMNSHVLVAGLGGVGGIAAEMLVRGGVGKLTIIDSDVVDETNRNRQIPALISTQGRLKTEVMAERLLDINPLLKLDIRTVFLQEGVTEELLDELDQIDYAVDCIDTLSPKVFYLKKCLDMGIPVISSMGAGGKIDPTCLQVADISESKHCNLARYVRKRLRALGIYKGIKVVYSPELADPEKIITAPEGNAKKSFIGTMSYMPAVFGCTVASVVIRDISGMEVYRPTPARVPKKKK
jgi:tRNA A37 threonylcarbamoyladenosine dehydratase